MISQSLRLLSFSSCLLLAAEEKPAPKYEMADYIMGLLRRGPNWTASSTEETQRIRPATSPSSLLLDFPRVQRVIPLGAHGVRFYLESVEIFTFHLLSSLINTSVQEGLHFQSSRRARPPNLSQHDFHSLEGLSVPIRSDVAEQTTRDRVSTLNFPSDTTRPPPL